MIREITTSSMLAAQELAKDTNLSSAKDFQYLENYKYTLEGDEIIKISSPQVAPPTL